MHDKALVKDEIIGQVRLLREELLRETSRQRGARRRQKRAAEPQHNAARTLATQPEQSPRPERPVLTTQNTSFYESYQFAKPRARKLTEATCTSDRKHSQDAEHSARSRMSTQVTQFKKPRLYHVGGGSLAVRESPLHSFHADLQATMDRRVRQESLRHSQHFAQLSASVSHRDREDQVLCLEDIVGPPRKLDLGTSNLQHEYEDLKITSILTKGRRTFNH